MGGSGSLNANHHQQNNHNASTTNSRDQDISPQYKPYSNPYSSNNANNSDNSLYRDKEGYATNFSGNGSSSGKLSSNNKPRLPTGYNTSQPNHPSSLLTQMRTYEGNARQGY